MSEGNWKHVKKTEDGSGSCVVFSKVLLVHRLLRSSFLDPPASTSPCAVMPAWY